MSDTRDLVILGGGLVGMTLALAAAKQGISSFVVDPEDPDTLTAAGADGRASAISTASWNLFSNIGLADALEPLGCPIDAIAVTDANRPGRIDFRPEPHEGTLGRMFANRDIRLALFAAAQNEPLIDWRHGVTPVERVRGAHGVAVTLADGTNLRGNLLVGAEGRGSPSRNEAGFSMAKWDYSHRAIVAGLTHNKSHQNVAWEIFYPAGPFALLPLRDDAEGRHRSALVWTVAEADAAGYLALSDTAFLAEARAQMGDVLGEIALSAPRMGWPLSLQHSGRIVADRLALIGDSAHGMHPIAGQGLNLGLRDVGTLVEVIAEGMRLGLEPGDAQVLARYEKWRSVDTLSVMVATDTINRLFAVPGRLPSVVRRLGMGLIQRTGWLKRWFMDEARGMSGKLPGLLRG